MDTFLKLNFTRFQQLDLTKYEIFQKPISFNKKDKPCFFPADELSTDKRHLTLTRSNTWYDYTAKKEFSTFDHWLDDTGYYYLSQIRFGFNRFDGRKSSISLPDLLTTHGYYHDPKMDEVTKFIKKLTIENKTLESNVLVWSPAMVQSYNQFMKE